MLRKFFVILIATVVAGFGGLVAFMYAAPEAFTRVVVNAGRNHAGLERKEVVLASGLRYVYLDGGQGEPLLLLHGFGANKDAFVQLAPYLVKHYRVLIPDHIGFGESAHPADADYGPDAQAGRLHELMQALGFNGKVHVGGNSMGGLIAMHYGIRFPADTADLWLMNPAGVTSAPPTDFFKAVMAGPKNPLLVTNTDDLAYVVSQVASKPPFIPRPMLEVLAQERIANQTLEKKIVGALFKDRTEQRVAGMPVPTLIVWGAEDKLLSPAGAEILHKLIPDSQVMIMPGIGHIPMIEDPAAATADYLRFQAARKTAATKAGG